MKDLTLQQSIMDELEYHPEIEASHIGVAVEDGIVTLTGHVKNYSEKLAIERAVRSLKGVRAIAEEIEIRLPGLLGTTDDMIAARVANIISWNAIVPERTVSIKVQAGCVTLEGEVDWQYQRRALENAIRKLTGVKAVNNFLKLKIRPDAANVQRKIEEALKRNAEVDARGIHVNVTGNVVKLEGRVNAWHERQVAERAAWSVAGVTRVEDHLLMA
jgi:osmotically-inducible protein OsmY